MSSRLPPWLRRTKQDLARLHEMKRKLRGQGLHTVCEEARCPNIGECFGRTTATFLIMGPVCSRHCGFCNVAAGLPAPLDPEEPYHVAQAAKDLGLRHVVITSVTRDDLPLGGAGHFVETILAVRETLPAATIEVLTPDFQADETALVAIAQAPIQVFNHNVETVARLYPTARPQADYRRSLFVLKCLAALRPDILVKSGFMLGLGETDAEVVELLADLRAHRVNALTIGQYLRPRLANLPVERYVPPEEFAAWEDRAKNAGFAHVAAGPLVRSSYQADRFLADETRPLALRSESDIQND